MAELVQIRLKVPKAFSNPPDIWDETKEVLAATLQTNRGFLFMESGRYNGHEPWAPLRYRKGQPLMKSGARGLSGSMAPRVTKNGTVPGKGPNSILRYTAGIVTIGTTLPYASLMNWGTSQMPGGVMKAKNAQALRFKIGRRWVFCKSVKIPPRRFDTFTPADVEEIETTLANTIARLLNE